MLNTVRFIIAAFAIIFYSCSEDDTAIGDQFSGQWNLVDRYCECPSPDLNMSEHIWRFDLFKNNVFVQNVVQKQGQVLESGNYEFELTDSTIKIKSVTYDYYFEEGKLFLQNGPCFLLKFVRG